MNEVDRECLYMNSQREEFFDSIDSNRSGKVTLEEFLEKALRIKIDKGEEELARQFEPELRTIDREMVHLKVFDLKMYFNVETDTVPKTQFMKEAGGLGLNIHDDRYLLFVNSFLDRELLDCVDIRRVLFCDIDAKRDRCYQISPEGRR